MKKFSFVIPAYNCEKVIERCITSLVNQGLQDYEIVVVNDGSKDNTLEVLKNFAQKNSNIKVIDVVNGGPSRARNIGLSHATGEYVLMIDSDDYLNDNTCITRYVSMMEDEGLDLVVFGCRDVFLKDGEIIKENLSEIQDAVYYTRKTFFDNIGNHLLQQIMYSASNKIYKMQYIKQRNIEFQVDIAIEEDFRFNLAYFPLVNKCRFVEESPYSYIHEVGNNSLSQKYVPDVQEISKATYDKLIEVLNLEGAYQGINKKQVDTYFVKRISGWINSLYTNSCTLDKRGKISFIQSAMKDEVVRKRIDNFIASSKKDLILYVLIKYKMATLCYWVYEIINKKRYRK